MAAPIEDDSDGGFLQLPFSSPSLQISAQCNSGTNDNFGFDHLIWVKN